MGLVVFWSCRHFETRASSDLSAFFSVLDVGQAEHGSSVPGSHKGPSSSLLVPRGFSLSPGHVWGASGVSAARGQRRALPGFCRRRLPCVPRGPAWPAPPPPPGLPLSPPLTTGSRTLTSGPLGPGSPWTVLSRPRLTAPPSPVRSPLAGCVGLSMSCEAPSAWSDHTPHLCGSRWPQACWPPWQKAPWTANGCACCLSRNSTSCAFEEADLRWARKSSETTRSARPLFTASRQ